jgi:hypothetical protein
MLNSIKTSAKVIASMLIVAGVVLGYVFGSSTLKYDAEPIVAPDETHKGAGSNSPADDLMEFFPNGEGQAIGAKTPLVTSLAGLTRSLSMVIVVKDVEMRNGSVRQFRVMNLDGLVADQLLTIEPGKTEFVGDELLDFPAKAVMSRLNDQPALFVPVDAGMRYVTYAVLPWNPAIEKFVALNGPDRYPVRIDGRPTETSTLTNPFDEGDGWLHESTASGSGPEYLRCSKFATDGSLVTAFDANYNFMIGTDVVGDWALEVRESRVRTGNTPASLAKSATFTSSEVRDFGIGDGHGCSDWIEKFRALREERVIDALSLIRPQEKGSL